MSPPVELTVPLKTVDPTPTWVKFPATELVAAAVKTPELLMVTTPLFVVVNVPLRVTSVALIEIPAAVLMSVAPFNVVAPLPVN